MTMSTWQKASRASGTQRFSPWHSTALKVSYFTHNSRTNEHYLTILYLRITVFISVFSAMFCSQLDISDPHEPILWQDERSLLHFLYLALCQSFDLPQLVYGLASDAIPPDVSDLVLEFAPVSESSAMICTSSQLLNVIYAFLAISPASSMCALISLPNVSLARPYAPTIC